MPTKDDEPRVHNKHHGTAPEGAVYIGRGSPWGNPFTHLQGQTTARYVVGSRKEAIRLYASQVMPYLDLEPLRGKHLVCSCKPLECHGDLLLRAANQKKEK